MVNNMKKKYFFIIYGLLFFLCTNTESPTQEDNISFTLLVQNDVSCVTPGTNEQYGWIHGYVEKTGSSSKTIFNKVDNGSIEKYNVKGSGNYFVKIYYKYPSDNDEGQVLCSNKIFSISKNGQTCTIEIDGTCNEGAIFHYNLLNKNVDISVE